MQSPKKKELKKAMTTLVRLAKRVYPGLEYRVGIPGYEEEDAHIWIYCPPKYENKVHRAMSERWYKLLSQKDIFIGTSILPPNGRQRNSA